MAMVRVNLNAVAADGTVRVRGSRFSSPAELGQLVEFCDPAAEVSGTAKVARVNAATGLVYLDIVLRR